MRKTAEIPEGVLGRDRLTVPANPPRLDIVIVELCENPGSRVRLAGLRVTLKSTTLKVPLMLGWMEQ